jgi:hypothetical protein
MRANTKTIVIVLVLAGIAYWGLFLGGFENLGLLLPGGGGTATLQVQTNDAIGEVVFSPAGASVKVWDKATGDDLGALTEDASNDGKWTSAYAVPIGSVVVVKVADSGNTYYTRQVERKVNAPAAGVDRVSILDPIKMYPRSATSSSDLAGALTTAGTAVTNATGIATGETDILVTLTAASGYTWGGQAYHDYETGKDYLGAFMVWDLTTTTASATITGPWWEHFSIGSHEYWIFKIPQIVNDADLAGDGTYSFTITFNNLAAAVDALDVACYTNAKTEDVMAKTFGTADTGNNSGELWIDIHLNS